MSEMYKIFQPECFYLEGDTLATIKNSNNSVEVKGLIDNNSIQMVWSSEDIVNHSYVKYKTQNNYTGVEFSFSFLNNDTILGYSDIETIQCLKIEHLDGSSSEIPFGFLGKTELFVHAEESVVFGEEIKLPKEWIKWNSLLVGYTKGEENGICTEDEDFRVDYVRGTITFFEGAKIPEDASYTFNGQYHSSAQYIINFNRLFTGIYPVEKEKVSVGEISKVIFPINFLNKDYIGESFNFGLADMVTSRGDLWQVATALRNNGFRIGENYDYSYNINPRSIAINNHKLGYEDILNVNIGTGKYSKLENGFLHKDSPLNNVFIYWYQELISKSIDNGVKKVQVVIPNNQEYFPSHCCQATIDGSLIFSANPIHPEVVEYYKSLMKNIKDITSKMVELEFVLDKYHWTYNEVGDMGIYDEYSIDAFKSFLDIPYLDYDKYNGRLLSTLTDDEYAVVAYLRNRLNDVYTSLILDEYNVSIITDSVLFEEDYAFSEINRIGEITNFKKVYIYENNWINASDYISKIQKVQSKYSSMEIDKFGFIVGGIELLEIESEIELSWQNITPTLFDLVWGEGIVDVIVTFGHFVRRDNYFVYKPLPHVEMNHLDISLDLSLYRANKKLIGNLPVVKITDFSRSISDIDSISFTVPYQYMDRVTHNMKVLPHYHEIMEERIICVNENEYFVIKDVSEVNGETIYKDIKAYSIEQKLSKSDVVLENLYLQLHSDDPNDEMDGVLNILTRETGWRVSYIDANCKFEKIDNLIVNKYRWFESVSEDWYTFLTETVSRSFSCIIQFNTYNKTINVYDANEVGVNKGLYLTKDNFVKSLGKNTSSNEIATRLRLYGKEELTISSINPTGQNYLEDYSYFIELGDMSKELENALVEYNETIEKVFDKWQIANGEFLELNRIIMCINTDLYAIYEEIKVLTAIRDTYIAQNDNINANKIQEEIDTLTVKKIDLEEQLQFSQTRLVEVTSLVQSLNEQIDRKNTVNEQGDLIFTQELLDELNEFIYYDTYTDDTYITPESLMEGGLKVLSEKCRPTTEYSIDTVNFMERLSTKKSNWSGDLALGDIVILFDNITQEEVYLYFVGYNYNKEDKTLQIKLSNKKVQRDDTLTISKLLSKSQSIKKIVDNKKYLWNRLKYHEKI